LTRGASLPEAVAARVRALGAQGLMRTLPERTSGLDLCSNDTLGFATDPVLRAAFLERVAELPLGATASRLVRPAPGTEADLASRVEATLATFVQAEATLLLPSGFQANAALIGALCRPGDVVFSDALNHASIIDALRTSGAQRVIYRHADPESLEALLSTHPCASNGARFVVTESVFSMDGDRAPLQALVEVAEAAGAHVLVDEAHATGLWGAGAGCVVEAGLRDRVLATLHTGGKALGAGGGFIAGGSALREALVALSRAFIYSTGVLPALACALEVSVEHHGRVGAARTTLALGLATYARGALATLPGIFVPAGDAPIVPIVLGDASRTLAVAHSLRRRGFEMRGFRPPTVPEGTSRLRLVTRATLSELDLERFVDALGAALNEAR
jgi:7-keto-8-aminopelargonate synthetase-like enzyme